MMQAAPDHVHEVKQSESKQCKHLQRLRTVPETVSVCQYLFKGKVEGSNI